MYLIEYVDEGKIEIFFTTALFYLTEITHYNK